MVVGEFRCIVVCYMQKENDCTIHLGPQVVLVAKYTPPNLKIRHLSMNKMKRNKTAVEC